MHIDIIGCKIRGLRGHSGDSTLRSETSVPGSQNQDDGTREMKIFGCEYRVAKQDLIDALSHYGELLTDIVEELFEDGMDTVDAANGSEEGTNRTGTYVLKIRLHSDVPELLPISGRRIRIKYPGVKIMCTKCFGSHHKTRCQSAKQNFKDYVIYFARLNPEFPESAYGRWLELIKAVAPRTVPVGPGANDETNVVEILTSQPLQVPNDITATPDPDQETLPRLPVHSPTIATADWLAQQATFQPQPTTTPVNNTPISNETPAQPQSGSGSGSVRLAPTQAEYRVPLNQLEHNEVVANLIKGGSLPSEAELVIASRKTAFNKLKNPK